MKRVIVSVGFLVAVLLLIVPVAGFSQTADLSSIINGAWRVEFRVQVPRPNQTVVTQQWIWDANKEVFTTHENGGSKTWKTQVSGNMIQAESANTSTGQREVLTLQFLGSGRAQGTFMGMPGKPGESGWIAKVNAVKLGMSQR